MKVFFDSSVLVAAVDSGECHYQECRALLDMKDGGILVHAIAEIFSTLTGGKMGRRVPPGVTLALIREEVWPFLAGVEILAGDEVLAAFEEAETRGVRGGAVYDFLHLVAAKKAGAERLYTLNLSHFLAFRRLGDSEVAHPAQRV